MMVIWTVISVVYCTGFHVCYVPTFTCRLLNVSRFLGFQACVRFPGFLDIFSIFSVVFFFQVFWTFFLFFSIFSVFLFSFSFYRNCNSHFTGISVFFRFSFYSLLRSSGLLQNL